MMKSALRAKLGADTNNYWVDALPLVLLGSELRSRTICTVLSPR